ncbi:MAG TPA: hypothetical protein VEU30_09380, partial [Thermoanaerobaculia bacterium]|nr:hypothetical protein [Thermoanaerobaculia bacterium]
LATGTYRWVASYSGDANNSASANACGDPSETVVVTSPSGKASPTLVTTASPSVVVGGNIRDTAVLSGGNAPTGTILFRAYGPIDTLCSGAPVFTASVPVNGNATYNSPVFRPASAGVYNFVAIYGGDDNNHPATSPCGAPNESVRVTPVRPVLVAAASPNVPLGSTISNTATLAGGFRPQGSILFTVFGPDNTSCTGLPLFTSTTPVDGNGTYKSADFLPTETGTYSFVVEYRGDRNNQEVLVPCGATNSTVEVTCTAATAPIVSIVGEVTTGRLYPLLWTPVPDATAYEVQEATSEDFIDATTRVVTGTSTDFRHDAATPTPWFYRVRALDVCDQAFGPFSDPGRIVVVPLPPADRPDINVNIPFGTTEILVQPIFVPGVPGQTFTFTAAVDQPWLSVTPESGIFTPAGVTFNVATDPALLPNGTHTGTLIVTLTTIDEAGRGVGTEGVTSVSTTVSVNLVTPVTNLPSTTPQTNSILIPSLGHLQGASARWQSDIRVLNSTTSNQTYQVLFTPASEYGSGKVKTTLVTATPGQTIALDDVVRNWFGLGSLDDRTSGYLEIRPLTLTVPKAIASSRTYSLNPGSKGTLGQFIPALSFNDFIGSVTSSPSLRPPVLSMQQIAQSESFRTNVGLIEASGKPASALLSVFNTSGANLLSLPIDLGAGEQKQLNSLLAQHGIALDDGRIEVQLTSGEGKVTAFASVIDNRSGVPLLVSGVPLGATQSTRYVLPGVADLNTASARWRTDMRVFNPDSEARSATLTFHPQNNGGAPVTREITLGPGAIRTLDDVVQSLFGQADIGGAVHVTTSETSSLVVTGRTYNITANGTLGQFIPAVTPAEAVGRGERTLQILQAEDSVRYRTNLGLAEVTGRAATVEVTVILPDAK